MNSDNSNYSDSEILAAALSEIEARGGRLRGINKWIRDTFGTGGGRAARLTREVQENSGSVFDDEPSADYTIRYDSTGEDAPSPAELMGLTGLDPRDWQAAKVDVWHRGEQGTRSKVVLKPRSVLSLEDRLATLLEAQAERLLSAPPKPSAPALSGGQYMLEVSVVDPHFGKLASGTNGEGEYDLSLARKAWARVVSDLLAKGSMFPLERVDAVIGSDGLHAMPNNRTVAHTEQDVDGFWFEAYNVYLEEYISFIEAALEVAPRFYGRVVPGNHAGPMEIAFAKTLKAYFRNYESVTIDDSPRPHKVVHYGQNLILWTHGDKTNFKELAMSLAVNHPELWGQTRYREVHTGDKHHRRRSSDFKMGDYLEHRGVITRISPAMCLGDAWHFHKQFTGCVPGAEAYVWHRDKGVAAVFNANL